MRLTSIEGFALLLSSFAIVVAQLSNNAKSSIFKPQAAGAKASKALAQSCIHTASAEHLKFTSQSVHQSDQLPIKRDKPKAAADFHSNPNGKDFAKPGAGWRSPAVPPFVSLHQPHGNIGSIGLEQAGEFKAADDGNSKNAPAQRQHLPRDDVDFVGLELSVSGMTPFGADPKANTNPAIHSPRGSPETFDLQHDHLSDLKANKQSAKNSSPTVSGRQANKNPPRLVNVAEPKANDVLDPKENKRPSTPNIVWRPPTKPPVPNLGSPHRAPRSKMTKDIHGDEGFASPSYYPTPSGGWVPKWIASYTKARALVGNMTLAEKVNITTGTGWQMGRCVGNTGPAHRVGFPSLCLQDGPLGVRFADLITAFPAGITTGSTFDEEIMFARGKAMGEEARKKGVNALLGPCVGPLGRSPLGGRNWEGFGSDPYLQGLGGYQTVAGIQSEGVIATVKHFIGNEQEHYREYGNGIEAISSNIDDRTLHEIYLWPFAEAVRAGAGSVMCSYQRVNNSYSCQNSKLLNGILKDELGFQGFVVSDWLGQRSGVASALAGLDMSMPGDGQDWANGISFWGSQLSISVLNESIPLQRLNDAVTRIIATWYQLGQDNEYPEINFSSWTMSDEDVEFVGAGQGEQVKVNEHLDVQNDHARLARKIAAESIVLLKNTAGILPLENDTFVATFGSGAGDGNMTANGCGDRGCDQGVLGMGWGSGTANYPYLSVPDDVIIGRAPHRHIYLSVLSDNITATIKSHASTPGLTAIVFINADSGEGYITVENNAGDRNDIFAWHNGDALVQAVAAVCKRTVVVVNSVGPIVMEGWIDLENVKAVVLAHLPSQEAGNAIADVLYGDINPSGKLPYTIGKTLVDYGETGVIYDANGSQNLQQKFSEGAYFDYRHFDKYGITPRFEFGYGLSYTTFKFIDLGFVQVNKQSRLPDTRPKKIELPVYKLRPPNPFEVTWPADIKTRIKKYIYPYVGKATNTTTSEYPYPPGYSPDEQPEPPSGGAEGGNPALFETMYNITVSIINTGGRTGKIAAQLYIGFPNSTFDTPIRQLRGIKKIELRPNEMKQAVFSITRKDLSQWDVVEQNWIMSGSYDLYVGRSSRDLPARCLDVPRNTCWSSEGNWHLLKTKGAIILASERVKISYAKEAI